MALIRPFRAYRYAPLLAREIERYTSPLFDVVTREQLDKLYLEPNNSIHISVPRREPGGPTPSQILDDWKANQVIKLEPVPAIYPYYQHFTLPGESGEFTRKGFIALIEASSWEFGPVHRHESTMPVPVKDRLQTLSETMMQVNPTHGLYHDPDFKLEAAMDEAMLAPLCETEDYQGVRDTLAVIHDRELIKLFMGHLATRDVVLADGHHRYEASVALRGELASSIGRSLPKHRSLEHPLEPWNYHLMYLTNDANPDLRILATHRLLKNIGTWPANEWRRRLEVFFDVREIEDPSTLPEVISGKKHAFGFILPNAAYKLRLKPAMLETIDWDFPDVVKELDLTIIHYFIIWRILGVAGTAQRKSDKVAYERNFFRCLQTLESGNADAILVTNPVTTDSVRAVASLGQTMPPKSTYFYPKVLAGLVMASLRDQEFYSHADTSLGLPPPPFAP
jgi:uncharacterized protein (DUF1015 family)